VKIKMRRKGQAAMEFLMTYGWAIIVVLAAIAALAYFGVLSPANLLPERTTFAAPIQSLDNAVILGADNTVTIALSNNLGARLTVDAVTATGDCTVGTAQIAVGDGAYAVVAGQSVLNGESFRLELTCTEDLQSGDRFSADFTITYTNTASTLQRPHTGSVQGRII
jgi:uncharacterized protein (UPF0333 family)